MEEKKNEKTGVWGWIKKILIGIGAVLLGIFCLRRGGVNRRGIQRAADAVGQLRQDTARDAANVQREAGRIEREGERTEAERGRLVREKVRLAGEAELLERQRAAGGNIRSILERAKARTEQGEDK